MPSIVPPRPILTVEQKADRAIEQFRRRYIETPYPTDDAVAAGIARLERSTERVLRDLYGLPSLVELARVEQLSLLQEAVMERWQTA